MTPAAGATAVLAPPMPNATSRRAKTEVLTVDQIPEFVPVSLETIYGHVENFVGIQRTDNRKVVSVMSSRYALVQHRDVARIVDRLADTLGAPTTSMWRQDGGNEHFTPRKISLSAGGAELEYKFVVPQEHRIDSEHRFYPGVRVTNSINGKLAVTVSGFALRLACTNQMYGGFNGGRSAGRKLTDVRELHLSGADDVLGAVEKGVYDYLGNFGKQIKVYAEARNRKIVVGDVLKALLEAGIPEKHSKGIEEQVRRLPVVLGEADYRAAIVSRWDAYNAATDYLTHQVRVAPPRERLFERKVASAILLEEEPDASGPGDDPSG